ncbi:PAS domain-containing sensor histidine kinase [Rhodopseudomonas palustris]|uniref:histidine kinase n=1 Tax=Rhodopseudomonas palustris TaxID=1076 RepID=A0A323UGM6_RHOPL|nr:ATP-binding protein [Rhodopseudomonas palustris]PZA11263.1 PAS domain-containing sensor histidine kinase [Rhodopseudomonas palustris]
MPDRIAPGERLIERVGSPLLSPLDGDQEAAWIEVIRKMDEVYADLLRYETDLEEKNTALEEAQAFISSVIESVSDILIVCDRNGIVLQVNPAAVRLLATPADAVVERPLGDLVDAADGARIEELLRAPSSSEIALEIRFVTAHGLSDLYAINGATRCDQAGHRVGTVLTGRPIGELRRAYEALHTAHGELQRAQRQLVEQEKMASLGRLVAGVAHELNNPISFIYGNIHMLERYRERMAAYLTAIHGGADPAEVDELRRRLKIDALLADYASLIEGTLEGAMRVSDVVKNLRRLSFPRTGETQPIDVDRIVRTAARWAARAKPGHVELAFDIAPEATVIGNEGQFHQIMVNLVDNAIDALRGHAAPRIEISARRQDDEVAIAVADNGPGLPDGMIDKIFEPFFTTKPVGEGTGLGLWISYGIAREHGGTLAAANRNGGGAVFTLTLKAGP